jgi:hypothetical protein
MMKTLKLACRCQDKECADLPTLPGPCVKYVPCICDFPTVKGHEHCQECQHTRACHEPEVTDSRTPL